MAYFSDIVSGVTLRMLTYEDGSSIMTGDVFRLIKTDDIRVVSREVQMNPFTFLESYRYHRDFSVWTGGRPIGTNSMGIEFIYRPPRELNLGSEAYRAAVNKFLDSL